MSNPSINFNQAKSSLAKAIFWDWVLSNFLVRTLLFLLVPGTVFGLGYTLLFYTNLFGVNEEIYLGLSFLILFLSLLLFSIRTFVEEGLKIPDKDALAEIKQKLSSGAEVNLFDALSFDLAKAWSNAAIKNPLDLTLQEIGQTTLAASDTGFLLLRLGLPSEEIVKHLEGTKGLFGSVLSRAIDLAIALGHSSVWSGDILISLVEHSAGLKAFFEEFHITEVDLSSLLSWQTKLVDRMHKNRGLFNTNNLKKTGGVGKDWVYGYTNYLRQFSIDLTETIRTTGLNLEIVGRDREISQISEALTKQTNANVLIVGNAGTGKHTTILGFAKRVIDGETPDQLKYNEIFQVDTEALISGVSNEGEIINRFSHVLAEAANAGNVIILIENIDNLFSAQGVGTADLSAILIPYLEHNSVNIIGTCDVGAFNEFIATNAGLSNHFVRVSIEQPIGDNLIRILEDTAPMIEIKTGSIVTFEAIKLVVKEAAKFLVNSAEPERSIGMLEGVVMRATSERGKTIVLDKDVEEYLAEKFKLPTKAAEKDEKKKLLNLEQTMHGSVIGQDEAVKAVASAMRRSRAQISDSPKPIGSFLFLGPTGVGKTETAKALAKAYFGGVDQMIRFDMSEYQNSSDIYRLIGSKDQPGNLTTFVAEKPYSLLLFDEIEKAYPDILNLFLQILDEGTLTDGRDQKVIFTNTIIIATSNAGSDVISQTLSSGADYSKLKSTLLDYLIEKGAYKPEFLNRFTEVVAFSPLTLESIGQVAGLMINNLARTIAEKQGINVEIAPETLPLLAQMGYGPKMGARPMARVIQDKIENLLADKILRDELKKGDSIVITPEMIGA